MNSVPQNRSGAFSKLLWTQFEQIQWGGVKLTALCRCTAQMTLQHDFSEYKLEP